MRASLTRRYRFPASHRLHVPQLSENENDELFGKCNNPYGHGHNYTLEVTVRGVVDGCTGLVVIPEALDRFVETRVLQRIASRNLNEDVPEFRLLVPTTENLAVVVAAMLNRDWQEWAGPDLALTRVHVQETARNGFELLLNMKKQETENR